MIVKLQYEIRKKNEVVGYFHTLFKIGGPFLEVPEHSVLKQPFNQKPKAVRVPIKRRIVSDDGVDVVIRTYLDATRKSDRQIEVLKQGRMF